MEEKILNNDELSDVSGGLEVSRKATHLATELIPVATTTANEISPEDIQRIEEGELKLGNPQKLAHTFTIRKDNPGGNDDLFSR